jgi:Tfp pilus assembly PilM family ATPase
MPGKNTVVGLDMGRYAVKAAWLELRAGSPVLTRCESVRLSSDHADNVVAISQWIENMGIKKFPCVLGLPGEKAMFQPMLLLPNDPRTLEQAASIEILKFNELASENMLYGYSPISLNQGERRLILAMARQAIVKETLDSARNMGLDVIDVVPSPIALFNALELCSGSHDEPHLHINIGAVATELAIGSTAGLLFARAFPGGGQMFTDALAQSTKLSTGQAENLKTTEGSLSKNTDQTTQVLSKAADAWFAELQASLSVYQSLFPGRKTPPIRVVLAGGGAELRGFGEFISSKMNLETVRTEALPGQARSENAGRFAVAAGLAICGLRSAPIQISLLPELARDQMNFRRKKPFWTASAIAATLVVAVSLAGGYYNYHRMEKHLSAQESSLKASQELVNEIEIARDRSEQMLKMTQPVGIFVRGAPLMREIITLVANSKAPGDSITMICDADSYFTKAAPVRTSKTSMRDRRRAASTATQEDKPDTGIERILIEGTTQTPDFSTVKDLIIKLKALDFVVSADLLNDDETVSGSRSDAGGQRFVVDVKTRAALP